MAVTFLEPGGDATGNVALTTAGGFWANTGGAAVATDIVHGDHVNCIKYTTGGGYGAYVATPASTVSDTGGRISFYLYLDSLPTSGTAMVLGLAQTTASIAVIRVGVTTGGVLQLISGNWPTATQYGTDGPTLSTGVWYRICLAYTINTSSQEFLLQEIADKLLQENGDDILLQSAYASEFRVFVDGTPAISVSNPSLTNVNSSKVQFGDFNDDPGLVCRSSDHYVDNDTSLTDTGDVWVTAKRPNANGTLNEWTTQIGAGGSGYGSGHSPQVNERALDTANGWSFQDAALKTEEYTIESAATGDIDITGFTIVDFVGWVYAKVGSASTGNIIVAGSATNISLTTAYAMFTKVAGSTTYPSTGAAIGMDTNTVNQLFSLAECGIMVAYRVPGPSASPSVSPSQSPSASISPSRSPSISPSVSPSVSPSQSPSASVSPSRSPSVSPSVSPSQSPSASVSPSISPSVSPSVSPSQSPSASVSPSISPSRSPSISPSVSPSASPSASPSISPSRSPSVSPSVSPSAAAAGPVNRLYFKYQAVKRSNYY